MRNFAPKRSTETIRNAWTRMMLFLTMENLNKVVNRPAFVVPLYAFILPMLYSLKLRSSNDWLKIDVTRLEWDNRGLKYENERLKAKNERLKEEIKSLEDDSKKAWRLFGTESKRCAKAVKQHQSCLSKLHPTNL